MVAKETTEAIVSSLHNIFKDIKRLGKYPTKQKIGIVTPIFKKSSKSKVENYRPVTLLDSAGKIHERCVYFPQYNQFMKFV